MQTIQLDIQDDKFKTFLTIIDSLKNGIVDKIRLEDEILDIEIIEKDSEDYKLLQRAREESDITYSMDEAKKLLGL